MSRVVVRPLHVEDRAPWEGLWRAYLAFYESAVAPEVTSGTWARLHDAAEPMFALGAFKDDNLVGIVHYLFDYSPEMEYLEVVSPADFGTVDAEGMGAVPAPMPWKPV